MRRTIALMLVAAMASGCVATQRTPPEAVLVQLRAITIVPIEAPPLLLHPETDADRAAIAAVGLASPGRAAGFNPVYLLQLPLGFLAAPIYGVIYGVASSSPRAGEAATMVKESPAWMPTTGLARIASQILQKAGAREVFVVEGYAQLPIEDRSVNVFLENWMATERRWYNTDLSMLNYTQLGAPRVDAVLEVGVSNYEYAYGRLILQVNVKLSDPTTKQVLGRARNADHPKAGPLALMLQDEGRPLRRLIESTGEAMLTQCLKDLGLIPR